MKPQLSFYALAGLGAFAALLFALERKVPLRQLRNALSRRVVINLGISALAFCVAAISVQPAASATLGWVAEANFGLLRALAAPPLISGVLAFVLMDLSFYYWHQLNHRVPLLWRFHNVHHVDPDLDVSTAFRFHFGEIALSAGFRVVQVVIIGPSLGVFLVYELALQANTLFHHGNLRLPVRVERVLNLLLVTPRMHGIHHSQVLSESRSNYGVVFPWWDRLHRTLRLNVPQSQLSIGVAGYSRAEDNGFGRALVLPFRRQRDYWTGPDGTPARRAALADERRTRMAE